MIVAMEAAESVMEMAIAAEPVMEMTIATEAVAIMEETVVTEVTEAIMEPEAVEVKRPVVGRIPIVEVAPGAHADEHAVYEIVRAPVTIGRAGVRIVRIKPVFAHRRRIVNAVARPDLNADGNLCL